MGRWLAPPLKLQCDGMLRWLGPAGNKGAGGCLQGWLLHADYASVLDSINKADFCRVPSRLLGTLCLWLGRTSKNTFFYYRQYLCEGKSNSRFKSCMACFSPECSWKTRIILPLHYFPVCRYWRVAGCLSSVFLVINNENLKYWYKRKYIRISHFWFHFHH